ACGRGSLPRAARRGRGRAVRALRSPRASVACGHSRAGGAEDPIRAVRRPCGPHWNETTDGFERSTLPAGLKPTVSNVTALPDRPDGTVGERFQIPPASKLPKTSGRNSGAPLTSVATSMHAAFAPPIQVVNVIDAPPAGAGGSTSSVR